MGEVYRARDMKLNRDVALKVLPESFATDPDRLARFQREAQVLASLNHPNIAHIHGLEDSGGVRALVMELVEGEDLTTRIARGPILLDEALRIARQIADALDAAHEKGIVHRDLKPTNIRITPDGSVKVLDFGLAKATAADFPLDDSARPTALGDYTEAGTVLGTAAYMAPEQAQGKAVDRRADIWAFGVVLYEMLTARSPFRCDTLADTLAAVLTKEPDWTNVPSAAMPLLRRCLAKSPKQRLRDVGDIAVLLDADITRTAPPTSRLKRWTPWSVAALSLTALVFALLVPRSPPARPDGNGTVRWTLDRIISAAPGNGLAISRDGRRMAYTAAGDNQQRLWVRDLDQPEAQPIVGTEGGKRPFFSPDGQWLAFFTGTARLGHLRKAPASSGGLNTRGAATTLCDDANLYGGTWAPDNSIIFSGPTGLMRVMAAGGTCEPLTKADPKEGDHRWPQILPGGSAVLFTIGIEGAFDSAHVAALDLKTGRHHTVLDGGANAQYVPSGHLVFVRNSQMFAVPFDVDRLQTTGTPQVVVDAIFHINAGGFAAYTISESGTLLYLTPRVEGFEWRDRRGNVQPVTVPPGLYPFFRLSPDATRVAVQHGGLGDIEIISLDRGGSERVTTEGMNNTPIWTRDGRAVTFATMGKGLYNAPLDGRRTVRALQELPGAAPWDWTPDGRTLVYEKGDPFEIWMLTVPDGGGLGVPRQLLASPNTSFYHPVISPDGRWLAYASNESGQFQVNVQAFPALGDKVMISRDGGDDPRWSKDGRELFYLTRGSIRNIMSVDVTTDSTFTAGPPKILLPSAGPFDVDATGQRFLILRPERLEQLEVVTNWFAELKRRVPVR